MVDFISAMGSCECARVDDELEWVVCQRAAVACESIAVVYGRAVRVFAWKRGYFPGKMLLVSDTALAPLLETLTCLRPALV